MPDILVVVLVMGGISIVLGVLLAAASKLFYVEVDERYEKIYEALPHFNCGACGYPGCAGMTEGLLKGEAKPEQCKPGTKVTYAKVRAILNGEDPDSITVA